MITSVILINLGYHLFIYNDTGKTDFELLWMLFLIQ